MLRTVATAVVLQIIVSVVLAQNQRVVPGVNPNHYQVDQHHQQQQQHYQQQQQPVQYQQQPQQVPQQQYQQQQQQPPQQQHQQHPQQHQQQQHHQQQQPPQHHQQQNQPHHHGGHQQPILAGNVQEEKAHIAEHMEVPMDTSNMSEQELQFHYFKMHDADNNNKLDGCELIKSLIHWHDQGSKGQHSHEHQQGVEEKIFTDEELVALIDPILSMDDYSRDGYIDYPEFVRAQQKAAQATAREAEQRQQQQQQQP